MDYFYLFERNLVRDIGGAKGVNLRRGVDGHAPDHADGLSQFVHGAVGGEVEVLEAQMVVPEMVAPTIQW